MIILPAIDLYEKKAVRLYKGDYANMTVYSDDPLSVAKDFEAAGAEWIHTVDLEGARDGTTPNLDVVAAIAKETSLKVEIGGGIRNLETVERYLAAGVSRVIIGTAAVTDEDFLIRATKLYGEKIAVGADVRDGRVAIKGWLCDSGIELSDFLMHMQSHGISTVICTDISKDGAMKGTNLGLYARLEREFDMNVVASGGVSTIEDVKALREMKLYGANIGKAYYTGAIDLREAIEVAK